MAGRTTGKSEKFEMRVPTEELADWRRRAAALSISVAELIRMRMRRGDDLTEAPVDPGPVLLPQKAVEVFAGKARLKLGPPPGRLDPSRGATVTAERNRRATAAQPVDAVATKTIPAREVHATGIMTVKPVATLDLPVLTEFPRQPTYFQRQQAQPKRKEKGKR